MAKQTDDYSTHPPICIEQGKLTNCSFSVPSLNYLTGQLLFSLQMIPLHAELGLDTETYLVLI